MKLYRGVGDIDLNKLNEFFKSDKEGTYGFGMYFAYQKEMARVWAVMRYIKKIGIIGEYEIKPPTNKLIVNQNGYNLEYDELMENYKKDKFLYWRDLLKFYEKFDLIIDEGKEVCLKKESDLDLISFTIIIQEYSNFTARDLFNELKVGELVSDNEIIDIPASALKLVQDYINQHQ